MHLSSQVCQCQYHHRNSSVFDFARWLLNLVRDSLDLESVREFARFLRSNLLMSVDLTV